MEGQTSRSYNSFLLFYWELPIQQELSITIELTRCAVHVLCGFSTGRLTISRKFSLLFENTMKTSSCFIASFRQTFLYVSVKFSCIYFSLCKVKIDGKTNSSTYLTSKIYYSSCQIYILPARFILPVRYICCILGRI